MKKTPTNPNAEDHARLLMDAVKKHDFRFPDLTEDIGEYLKALIRHVHSRDFSDAHELRLGKRRADWTPDEVRGFHEFLRNRPRPNHEEFTPGEHRFVVAEGPAVHAATDEELLNVAIRGNANMIEWRTADPTARLPVVASALLTDGRLLVSVVDSDNRIAFLKYIARTQPLYGFVLVFDAFMHSIDIEHGTATKLDAITTHIGSRTLRVTKSRVYRVVNGTVVWEEPRPDIDLRHLPSGDTQDVEDPYAGIFVSVPTPKGKSS